MDKISHDLLKSESLVFFGKINAVISHELKNIMAIISETAGLLDDLASVETPVAPDMVRNCTASIMEEIQRGFVTIRQMNRLAHSVDSTVGTVDLFEALDLVLHLSGFLSFAGNARLEEASGTERPTAVTSAFILQAVMYQILAHIYKHSGKDAETGISVQGDGDPGWRIVFSGVHLNDTPVFPDATTRIMAEAIGAVIRFHERSGRLELEIPHHLEETTRLVSQPCR